MKKTIFALLAIAAVMGCISCNSSKTAGNQSEFVSVQNGEFHIGDSVYRFVGANFWYAGILGAEKQGDRKRLAEELDSLQALGIDNLRILVGGDGDRRMASHIEPTLQKKPGVYDQDLLEGLDYLIAELEKRRMKAVLYLNNAWEWSGGYGTYLEWAGAGVAPVPSETSYPEYMAFVSQFPRNEKAKALFADHVRAIVGRTNSVTGKPYSESPAIMSWQIANEPRAFSEESKPYLAEWLKETAALIKSIDRNHLVSTGSEGKHGSEEDIELWADIHSDPNIDYANIHIWPYNWSWVRPDSLEADLENAYRLTDEYLEEHYSILPGKPIVLEEFGFPRDGMEIAIGTPTRARDAYYRHIFELIEKSGKLKGANFWGWGGNAEPRHRTWQPGDPYTGDPAQEDQGLNSVFSTDSTTKAIIRASTARIKAKR